MPISETPLNAAVKLRIPIKNLWLLLIYAADLGRFIDRFDADVEEASDLTELIARLLTFVVERRLRRNLSRGYVRREADLSRIRGRISIFRTFSHDLLQQGRVACRFDEHTINTPRNRLVRAALTALSSRVSKESLAHRCRELAGDLGRLGVAGLCPTRAEILSDRVGRHDVQDLVMITVARIVFDLVLPAEAAGSKALPGLDRESIVLHHLFEKAIGNFYNLELDSKAGWRVFRGRRLRWQLQSPTVGIESVLPGMQTDFILENGAACRRIIVDTKYTSIFTKSAFRQAVFKSEYIYQMYAYLRSQEGVAGSLTDNAEGILLHPAVDIDVDEVVSIQGHRIRFVTVDLMRPSSEILTRLREIPKIPSLESHH